MPGSWTCFGFFALLALGILCLVLWVRLNDLRDKVRSLENSLTVLARELHQRQRAGTLAPAERRAGESAGSTTVGATHAPVSKPVVPPLPPERPQPSPAVPHTDTPAGTSERLLGKLEEVRQKSTQPVPPVPATPTPTTPTAENADLRWKPLSVPPVEAPAKPAVEAPARPTPQPMAAAPAQDVKPAGKGWEAYIFTVGFVVLGAIILALAAIFLVKMAIDAGWFNAQRRDVAALCAGLALLGVGQWRRKYEGFWSQGATAAGIVTLFATFYAATSRHHFPFLQPIHGFVLLACTTATAVVMSLQNWTGGRGERKGGILIAALGLVGGFITPILVNTGQDNVPGLFGYLILLHMGLVAATRMRGWSVLAAISVVCSSAWLILWVLLKEWHPADGPIYGAFMLTCVASLVIATVTQPDKWSGGKRGMAAMALTWLAIGLGLLSSCLLLMKSDFSNLQWAFFACLVAGGFVLGRLRPRFEGMAWLASVIVLLMLIAWRVGNPAMPAGDDFVRWLAGFGAGCALAGYACQWKSVVPARWGLLTVLLAVAYVVAAYACVPSQHPRPDQWAYLPLGAAVVLAGLAVPVFMRRRTMATGEMTLAFYAHGVLTLLALAPPMALTDAKLTAAWCLLAPLTALALWRLRMPGLLYGLLAVLGLVVVRGIMVMTVLDAGGPGRTLWWNPVIWSYGSILLSMAASAWLLERADELPENLRERVPPPDALASLLHAGAAIAAFVLLTLEVRWGFHGGKLDDMSALLVERATFAVGWLALAGALLWIGRRTSRSMLERCGEVTAVWAMAYAVVALAGITNPLWWGDDVGTWRVFNVLMFAYGVPAAGCGLLAYLLDRHGRQALSLMAGVAGLVLLFALVTLQVRQGFAGPFLSVMDGERLNVTFTEFATYAIVWMTLGAACLAIGIGLHRELLRSAGVAFSAGGLAYAIMVPGVVMSPVLHHEWVGDWLIVNHLLYAYAGPLLLAALAMWIARPHGTPWFMPVNEEHDKLFTMAGLSRMMQGGIAILAFILLTTEIRQGFQHAYLDAAKMDFIERGTYTNAWLLLAAALLALGYRRGVQVARNGGLVIAGISMFWVLAVSTLVMNPLWMPQSVGQTPIFNWLLYHYGVPAAGMALLARALWNRDARAQTAAWIAGVLSLILIFVTVTLEVQQFFRGDQLAFGPGPYGELTAYSLAWAALGAVYLVVGILRRSTILRWASLAMMMLAICKLFLFDMQDLKDFERVLSFAGLGISLMVLALVYQRFVFRKIPQNPLT